MTHSACGFVRGRLVWVVAVVVVGVVGGLWGKAPHLVVWGLSCEWLSGGVLLSHTLSGAVPSALWVLASGFGMGPGVSPTL